MESEKTEYKEILDDSLKKSVMGLFTSNNSGIIFHGKRDDDPALAQNPK
jgi:hypothetical protein